MSRTFKSFVWAAVAGVPIILLPDPHAMMGDMLFFGQAAVAAIATLAGLAFWAFDRK